MTLVMPSSSSDEFKKFLGKYDFNQFDGCDRINLNHLTQPAKHAVEHSPEESGVDNLIQLLKGKDLAKTGAKVPNKKQRNAAAPPKPATPVAHTAAPRRNSNERASVQHNGLPAPHNRPPSPQQLAAAVASRAHALPSHLANASKAAAAVAPHHLIQARGHVQPTFGNAPPAAPGWTEEIMKRKSPPRAAPAVAPARSLVTDLIHSLSAHHVHGKSIDSTPLEVAPQHVTGLRDGDTAEGQLRELLQQLCKHGNVEPVRKLLSLLVEVASQPSTQHTSPTTQSKGPSPAAAPAIVPSISEGISDSQSVVETLRALQLFSGNQFDCFDLSTAIPTPLLTEL